MLAHKETAQAQVSIATSTRGSSARGCTFHSEGESPVLRVETLLLELGGLPMATVVSACSPP